MSLEHLSREENTALNANVNETASFEIQSSPAAGWRGDSNERYQREGSDEERNQFEEREQEDE